VHAGWDVGDDVLLCETAAAIFVRNPVASGNRFATIYEEI
jgi:hypothetical protein